MATVTEQVQAGMLTLREGRRLLRFPDLEQNEQLDNSSEERIFKILDGMVEDGKYTEPDPFMDLSLAMELTVKYYNLYMAAKLEEPKADMLRNFFKQCLTLQQIPIQAAQQQAQAAMQQQATPQANPQSLPTSPLVSNANTQTPQ